MTQRPFTPYELISPEVAEEIKVAAAERAAAPPFSKELAVSRRSPRTVALLEGATVFVPGTKSSRSWSAYFGRTFKPKGLRVRQFWAEYQGQTGHFVWAEPLKETPSGQ